MQLYTINATWVRPDDSGMTKLQYSDGSIYRRVVSDMLASYGIDGFTIQEVQGFWQGVAEQSYIITLACEDVNIIERFAESIRSVYDQDAVMVTYPDGSVKFIERPSDYDY